MIGVGELFLFKVKGQRPFSKYLKLLFKEKSMVHALNWCQNAQFKEGNGCRPMTYYENWILTSKIEVKGQWPYQNHEKRAISYRSLAKHDEKNFYIAFIC